MTAHDEDSRRSRRREDAPPPQEPLEETNPAHGFDDREAYAGRPDQDIKHTVGPGAGGATEWGGGNKNNPIRTRNRPPGG